MAQDWRDQRIAELEAALAASEARNAAKDARIAELEQRIAERQAGGAGREARAEFSKFASAALE